MGMNEDNASMIIAQTKLIRDDIIAIKAAIAIEINNLPDNPNITRISEKPSCFTIQLSEIAKNNTILSPYYHDWKYQYKMLIEKINTTNIMDLVRTLMDATDKGFFMNGKEKILLHPQVIEKLKSLL